jgi:hypothetical protein
MEVLSSKTLRPPGICAGGGMRIPLSSYCRNPTASLPGCCPAWAGSAPGFSNMAPPMGLVCVAGRLDIWIGGDTDVGMLEASPDCLPGADSGEGMGTLGSTILAPSTLG